MQRSRGSSISASADASAQTKSSIDPVAATKDAPKLPTKETPRERDPKPGFFSRIVGIFVSPKPEADIIAAFYERYGSLDDDDFDLIEQFNAAMSKTKTFPYVFHKTILKPDVEEAYNALHLYDKQEVFGIYSTLLRKSSGKEVVLAPEFPDKPLKQLVQVVKAEIATNHKDYLPKIEEKPTTGIPAAKAKLKEYVVVAKSNLDIFEQEDLQEQKAERFYKAVHTSIDESVLRVKGVSEGLDIALERLGEAVRTRRISDEDKIDRYEKFLNAQKAAVYEQQHFATNIANTAQSLCDTYRVRYDMNVTALDRDRGKKTIKSQLADAKHTLQVAVDNAESYTQNHQRGVRQLEELKQRYESQWTVGREILANLKASFGDKQLREYWTKHCFTMLGKGGDNIMVGGKEVRVAHSVAEFARRLRAVNVDTMKLAEMKSLLRAFQSIIGEREKKRSDYATICCLPFFQVKVRQDPTKNVHTKIKALNIDNLADNNPDEFEFAKVGLPAGAVLPDQNVRPASSAAIS